MPSRWDGKIPKAPKVTNKQEGRTWSPRPPKGKGENADWSCRPYSESNEGAGNPREPGQKILYSPEQIANYKSQWARYQRGLELRPDKIKQVGNNSWIYYYHSCDSPTGFWEVTVGNSGTYIKLIKPLLTILCARPFTLDELSGIDTDFDSVKWYQIQGRITSIHPAEGEGSLNPIFSIFGAPVTPYKPIRIFVEAPDDSSIFDVFQINTRPTDYWYYLGNVGNLETEDPQLKIPAPVKVYIPKPTGIQQGYLANPLRKTWDSPPTAASFVYETIWQQNTTGSYVDVQAFPAGVDRDFTISLNTHYRILARFNTYGALTQSKSNTIYQTTADINTKYPISDDQWKSGISYTQTNNSFVLTSFSIETISLVDSWNQLGYSSLANSFATANFSVETQQVENEWIDKIGYSQLKHSFQTDPLGGVVVG